MRRSLLSFSRRTPGSRGHGALAGNQKDIEPPWPPWHGECWLFKSAWASCWLKARCAEVRSMAAAPPRLLGPSLSYPSFSRRTPGPRGRQTLGGNQRDIEPPRPPWHGECWLFKSAWASCWLKARCAEVRSMAAAPPQLLGPRFRGGNEGERGGSLELHAPISLIVFPANAGIQGPPNSGWQPKGHRTTAASAARRVPSFEKTPSIMPAESSLR